MLFVVDRHWLVKNLSLYDFFDFFDLLVAGYKSQRMGVQVQL